jgi:tryptophan synthase alpha chain
MSQGLRTKKVSKDRIGLIGHVVADYPSKDAARAMIRNMVDAGVSVIEIQIPFSEPAADGPVFMAANHDALQNGVTVNDAFALMHEVTLSYPQTDFVFMTYLNIVYKAGYAAFVKRAADAGARGMIVPDLPLEYVAQLDQEITLHGLDNIRLVAPNTTPERLARICKSARGFVYAVARSGVTGGATAVSSQLSNYTDKIYSLTPTPVGLGFGIRSPEDVKGLIGVADYAIIGTAALQAWQSGGNATHRDFWRNIAKAASPA